MRPRSNSMDITITGQNSKSEEKKEKKKSDESIKLANKGTLKRRKQIRAKIEELEADGRR